MHLSLSNDGERKSSPPEKRSEPRSPVQASIHVSSEDALIGANGTTRDVSTAGMYFYTDAPLTIGQVVDLKILSLNVEFQYVCNGTIVRVDNVNSAASHHARGVGVRVNSICLCASAECTSLSL